MVAGKYTRKKSKLQVKKEELPSLFRLLKAQLHPKKYAPYDTLALPNELLKVCVFLHRSLQQLVGS